MNLLIVFDGRRILPSLQYDFFIQLNKHCNILIHEETDRASSKNLYEVVMNNNIDVVLFFSFQAYRHTNLLNIGDSKLKSKVPIALLIFDYYAVEDNPRALNLILEDKIDLIINRGWYDNCILPQVWLPFSVNEELFDTNDTVNLENRDARVIFIGSISSTNKYYAFRKKAVKILSKHKDIFLAKRNIDNLHLPPKEYALELKKYYGALSCSFPPLYNHPAKTMEILGVGTALMTTRFKGDDKLFGKYKPYFEYKDDLSDIVDVAKTLVSDLSATNEKILAAREIVKQKHSDRHRIEELYNILHALASGSKIPDVWR